MIQKKSPLRDGTLKGYFSIGDTCASVAKEDLLVKLINETLITS